jgi:hypothetical protein
MRHVLLTSVLVLLAGACGCSTGPSRLVVKGKLTNGGKTILPERRGGLTVVFTPEPGTGTTYPAGYSAADDSYDVIGPDRRGIPAGKYKVTLSMMPPTTTADGKDLPAGTLHSLQQQADQFNNKYSGTNSPIIVDVNKSELDIDLSQYK